MNKHISNVLFTAGIVCLLWLTFYFIWMVIHGLWADTSFRLVQILLMVGGGTFLALSKILKNQEEIIRLLREKRDDANNA